MERPHRKPKKKKSGDAGERPDLFGNAVSKPHSTSVARFSGTDNPRYLRALHALLAHPMPRGHLDEVAGCANGPDLIFNLRELGLGKEGLACTMIDDTDRDGRKIKRGVYHLTDPGRKSIHDWLRLRERKGGQ